MARAEGADGLASPDDSAPATQRWLREIELYEREAQDWLKRARQVRDRYKDVRKSADKQGAKYNVLWANTKTMLPSLYSRNPKPDIQRRFRDEDPVGRVVSDILERASSYFVDTEMFHSAMREGVIDYLLPGRCISWVRYEPTIEQVAVEPPQGQGEDKGEGKPAPPPRERLGYECVKVDYVNTGDFGHNIGRTWDEVWLTWRRVYLTRAECVKRFGQEKGHKIPLDHGNRDDRGKFTGDSLTKATIYECWDKQKLCAVWLHKDMADPIEVQDDPLRLDDFFPHPKPLFANLANDTLFPTPYYVQYQDQAKELDDLTARISSIQKSLKVAGVYDASAQGIGRLLSEGVDNQLIAVESWAMFAEKGGLKGAIDFLPLDMVAQALLALYQAREQVKQDLHEISGIPDIVRGESEPDETLGAQEIKTAFATNRISDDQREVQRYARDLVRIVVQIICNHFQLETIKQISGVQLLTAADKQAVARYMQAAQAAAQPAPPSPSAPPGMNPTQAPPAPAPSAPPMPPPQPPQLSVKAPPERIIELMAEPTWEEANALIRNNVMRCFRIDIETDSTIRADEVQQQQARADFIKSIGALMQQVEGAPPEMWPFLGKTVQWAARAFSVGKDLEGSLNQLVAKFEKQAAQPQQPKPDPETVKIQGQMQLQQQDQQFKNQQAQQDAALAQQKAQYDYQLQLAGLNAKRDQAIAEANAKAATDQHLNQLEDERRIHEIAAETAQKQFEFNANAELQIKLAYIKKETAIEVARITAKASTGEGEEARAMAEAGE